MAAARRKNGKNAGPTPICASIEFGDDIKKLSEEDRKLRMRELRGKRERDGNGAAPQNPQ
jgi:hypothetical protein